AVPQPAKRSLGIAPSFLWDNTAHVLGIVDVEKRRKQGKEPDLKRISLQHEKFVELHHEWLAGTDDPGLVAILRFLDAWELRHFEERCWPDEMRDTNVVFALEDERLDGIYLHDRAAAREIWTRRLEAKTAGSKQAQCLV